MSLFGRIFEGNKTNGMIDSFEIITLHESGMRYVVEYEFIMKEEGVEISQYGIRFAKDQERRILEKRVVCSKDDVIKVLNDCGMRSWDGFHGPHPKGVKDGIMFRLKATVNEGESIYAEGSQNFPKHYRDFRDWLYTMLNG